MPASDFPREGNARQRRQAVWCAGAGAAALLLGLVWWLQPDWFAARFDVAYPHRSILEHYHYLLRQLPLLIEFGAALLFALAFALWTASRRRPTAKPFPQLPVATETVLFLALLALDAVLSHRYWLAWSRPLWDDYWRFGEILHHAMTMRDPALPAAVRQFIGEYPHAPSPLTPMLIAVGMFIVKNSVAVLMALNLAATAGSLWLLRSIVRRLSPATIFWPLGVLFLAHGATARNCLFIQLDAINGFFVLLFFHLWMSWREKPTLDRQAAMVIAIVLGVFQKTTLFPLMALPTLVEVAEALRTRKWDVMRLAYVALYTAVVPLALFAFYLYRFEVGDNFQTQVALMGAGWNVLDFSLQRFVYATLLLLGPFLPLVALNRDWRRPPYLAFTLYIALFFVSMVVVQGPFWGRYYSHLLGAWLLLAAPGLGRVERAAAYRLPLYVFIAGTALFEYAIVFWNLL